MTVTRRELANRYQELTRRIAKNRRGRLREESRYIQRREPVVRPNSVSATRSDGESALTDGICKQPASAHDTFCASLLPRSLHVCHVEHITIRNDWNLSFCAASSKVDGGEIDGVTRRRLMSSSTVHSEHVSSRGKNVRY
jgi:hypothetical protein